MPAPLVGDYLLNVLFDAGPVMSGGMGPVPITEQELMSWQMNRGVRLGAWDCGTVRHLSRVYCSALHDAKEKNAAPPWTPVPVDSPERRDAVAASFRGLAKMFPAKPVGKKRDSQ